MSIKIKSIITRFAKGIISGAISAMMLVTITQPSVWSDFGSIINSLAVAGAFGSLTGLLLAVQKWASWIEE